MSGVLASKTLFALVAAALLPASATAKVYKHVFTFSVDGLHSSDVTKWVAARPNSTIAALLETGLEFTDAYTSAPSDSFPGTMAQFTGSSPRTHGVWYDDTWDRSYYAPGSNCSGPPGAEVLYDETIDYNDTLLFSGGINPDNLPMTFVNGTCTAVYPHKRLRVNTVFEVVHEAGFETAYTDKHPSYDIVRGPSGKGLSSSYFPEIAAVNNTLNDTIAYDQLHVNAWLDWIDGVSPKNSSGNVTKTPTLMGGNFQAVSVAQKTIEYNNDSSLSTGLLKALNFVDNSLGQIVKKLKTKGLYNDTLIIVASKHGQAPIDPLLWNEVDPDAIMNATGVPTAWITTDDIAMIFLNSSSPSITSEAVSNLAAQQSALKINQTISGAQLVAQGFGDPATDPAVPDIIVRPELGTCYTTSKAKTAEHGGLSDDDRKVACFVSNPHLNKTVFGKRVSTRQVGPTILKALGLNVTKLEGAVKEGTTALNGF